MTPYINAYLMPWEQRNVDAKCIQLFSYLSLISFTEQGRSIRYPDKKVGIPLNTPGNRKFMDPPEGKHTKF